MILRQSLYKGLQVPAGCYKNFYQIFYQKQTTFDKNYQKDHLWGRFLLVRTIDYY